MENIFTQSNETQVQVQVQVRVQAQVHSMVKPRKPQSKAKQLEEWRSILSNEAGDELRSKRWGSRALLRIYGMQEADEQLAGETRRRNGVGFTPADAKILGSLARQLQERGWLSQKQWAIVWKRLGKYAGQLMRSRGE